MCKCHAVMGHRDRGLKRRRREINQEPHYVVVPENPDKKGRKIYRVRQVGGRDQ